MSVSNRGVLTLCPVYQTEGACFRENPISLGDRTIGVADTVAVGDLSTLLEGTATHATGRAGGLQVGGESEQGTGTAGADHTGLADQQGGEALVVAGDQGEAGAVEHGSQLVVGVGFPPPVVCIVADRGWLSWVSGQFPKWHSMAVGDVPGAPASSLALVLQLAGVDCLQALGAGVTLPPVAVGVVAVAGVPDLVCLVDGHGRLSVVDLFSIEPQGRRQLPGRTEL